MTKAQNTKDKLLNEAKRLIWSRGYSNVSLRQIASAAQVDVALISRYFGGKMGLFEATLEDAFDDKTGHITNTDDLIDLIIDLFVHAPRDGRSPSAITLLIMNTNDEEVGTLIKQAYYSQWQKPLEQIIGDKLKTSLFMSAIIGFSLMEKSLQISSEHSGIALPHTLEYQKQLRHMVSSALTFEA